MTCAEPPKLNRLERCIAALITNAANTLQVRYVSSSPEERTAIATLRTVGASMSAAP